MRPSLSHMLWRFFTAILFLPLLFLVQCTDAPSSNPGIRLKAWMREDGAVKILCTTEMICDVVRNVGKGYVDALTLIQGDLDPHTYELVKGDNEKFYRADIVFYNGLGLEHGPSLQTYLFGSQKSVAVGDAIEAREPELILVTDGQIDPHIWLDVSLWAKTITSIVTALSQVDPSHAEEYERAGVVYRDQLQQLHEEIFRQMSLVSVDRRYLVTSHDAFNYFTRAYLAPKEEQVESLWRVRCQAPEGLAPESQISITDIQFIINHLKKHDVRVLFPESNVNKNSIKKILAASKESAFPLIISPTHLYGDAMGAPGSPGETYIKMMQHNGAVISRYLNLNDEEQQ
ncbi:zinc ABC transporter substrate-binding protein [Simkania negevensis]|uniref:Zinc ABC transporter substrate-binding protein n=1 Tax=Simkania negevensis TaxID=83561 RepID=A0ABS3ASG0_9BACT|nr:zinc ABC transporter substrate-binding protein [Simkania negevensis]